jgi:hypothetical protein
VHPTCDEWSHRATEPDHIISVREARRALRDEGCRLHLGLRLSSPCTCGNSPRESRAAGYQAKGYELNNATKATTVAQMTTSTL